MKRIVPPDSEVREGGTLDEAARAGAFAGHLRVREAAADERRKLGSLFPERAWGRWAEQADPADRSWAPVVERFENGKWVPIGLALVDVAGRMAFGLFASHRGRGFSSSALRAVLQYLREYTLTVLTVQLSDREPLAARVFERAGFVFAGPPVSEDRSERRYDFVIRDECTIFNVWM